MKVRLTGATLILGLVLLVFLTGCRNLSPVASFTYSPSSGHSPLTVSFDASASHDPDGTIVTYQWAFGDGSTGTDATTSHTYTTPSNHTYSITLTVTDDSGSQATANHVVSVTPPPPNSPPVASFTRTPSSGEAPLSVSFNASGSYDSDGFIASYTWSFGDGGSGSGVTASHTYSSAGTYAAQLTVTDDDGATDTTTIQVEVSASSIPEDLYVDANSGSDTDGDGTQRNPYKTITKAASVASGDGNSHTLHVAAGVYNSELGEESPLELGQGINLVGEGTIRDDVKIAVVINCVSNSSLQNVECYRGIVLTERVAGTALVNVHTYGAEGQVAIRAEGGENSIITGCLIEECITGIRIAQPLTVTNTEIKDCTTGIAVASDGKLALISGCAISNCGYGVYMYSGNATIENDTMTNNIRAVYIDNYSNVHLLIADTSITGSSITDNAAGLAVSEHSSASMMVDLGGGPLGSSGGNTITASKGYNIRDDRLPYSGSIYAKNNTWNDPQPSGTVTGPTDNPPNYIIKNEGNRIIFSD